MNRSRQVYIHINQYRFYFTDLYSSLIFGFVKFKTLVHFKWYLSLRLLKCYNQ